MKAGEGGVVVRTAKLDGAKATPVDLRVVPGGTTLRMPGTPSDVPGMRASVKLRESSVRIRCALDAVGAKVRGGTVVGIDALEPHHDLAIAAALLPDATSQELAAWAFVGELALDGRIRSVRGALPLIDAAGADGRGVVTSCEDAAWLPWSSAAVTVARNLGTLFGGGLDVGGFTPDRATFAGTMDDVAGHAVAKAAIVAAAEQRRPVLLVGPAGCGKVVLARRAMACLPPLQHEEEVVVMRTRSCARLPPVAGRAFCAPHHTCSAAGLTGTRARPGEAALAHDGILLLDDLHEFHPSARRALWDVLDKGVDVAGFPARPWVLATSLPCSCGFGGTMQPCRCSAAARERWADMTRPSARFPVVVRMAEDANGEDVVERLEDDGRTWTGEAGQEAT